ncbi:hypothetical protein [Bradyrhizobium sp. USDA 4451]
MKCLILKQGLGGDEAESSASALGVSHPAHADPAAPTPVARQGCYCLRSRNAFTINELTCRLVPGDISDDHLILRIWFFEDWNFYR